MNFFRKIQLLVVLTVLVVFHVQGQLISNHKVIYYSAKEFHAHNQTWQAAQADNGVIYFANGDGLLSYDGVDWKLKFTSKETNMLSIGIDQNQRIYYGAIGEVGYFEKNRFGDLVPVQITNEEYETTLSTEFYWNVHLFGEKVVFRSEHLWVAYEDGESTVYPVDDFEVKGSFKVGDYLWVQDEKSNVYRVHHDSLKYLSADRKLTELSEKLQGVSIQGLEAYSENKVMITGHGIKLMTYDLTGKSLEEFRSQLDDITEPGFYLNDLAIFPDKSIAVSTTTHGVYILNQFGNIVSVYNEENDLKSNLVRSIYYDREGLIWLTSDVGIYKVLHNKNYTLLSEQYEDVSGVSNTIIEYKGKLVVGTNDNVYYIKEAGGKMITEPIEGFKEQTFDLLQMGDDLLAATTSGLFLLDGQNYTVLSPKFSRALVNISSSYLLVGGRKELYLWKKEGNKWSLKNTVGTPDEFLHLEKDPSRENIYWGGLYSSGMLRIKVDTINHTLVYKHYDEALTGKSGYILPFSIQDRMIFAPKTDEIWEYEETNDQIITDEFSEELFSKDFSSWLIKEDTYGNLFYEASGPVYFCEKTEEGYEVDTTSLANLNVGYINDMFCSETGETWLVAEENIIRFNPNIQKQQETISEVVLKKIIINADTVYYDGYLSASDSILQKDFVLDYSNNNIAFDFVCPYYSDEENLLYSYQLKGNDPSFSPWSSDHKAIYTNLSEGEYTLLVKCKNADGIETAEMEFLFQILPPWYRTWYAYTAFVLFLIVLVIIIVKLNSLRLRKVNDNLQLLIKEKTKEISLNLEEISEQRDQLEERNNEIIDSINYAQRLQNAILPSKEAIDTQFPNNFVLYIPKDIVAGDFYWLHAKEQKAFIAAADCTGHGVPGALVSVVCNDALNQAANEFKLDQPDLILNMVNDLVKKMFSSTDQLSAGMEVRDGMDIALSHVCMAKKEVTFAGAHNSLWILTKNNYDHQAKLLESDQAHYLYEVKADRQPIGSSLLEKEFTRSTVQLDEGDIIYMFTDGIIDQFGGEAFGKIKKFKRKNLVRLFFEVKELAMEDQKAKIYEVFEQWRGEEEQLDDVTVIGIKF